MNTMKRTSLAAVAILVSLAVTSGNSDATTTYDCDSVIAHRGDTTTGFAAESVEAEVLAAKRGADYIEVDAQAAKNGVIYVAHDVLPDGSEVSSKTSREINAMRWPSGQKVAHLTDVLNAVKSFRDVKAFIELKSVDSTSYTRIRNATLAFGASRVVIQSFGPEKLANYAKIAPNQTSTIISDTRHGLTYMRPYDGIVLEQSQVTQEYVNILNSRGYKVYVYTPNSTPEWLSLPSGLAGVMTDNIEGYQSSCS